ncbi:plasma membrane-associated cation-binding protein 1-like [Cynara cardunculus var. scolymus]|uniref:plasma membrane-associated cation-binding protein 1-like n=1 Tax=Cynara cardunculus var. scolymus TaxID=59895 RepID=UPI000D628CC4|nr:plasma membrane-associated cation-binding protein 1-like [Cynara cardunculus var. scolymus]XP_024964533.1 plasma membrane-associated cation-binding protein 1-like [Cynara cardunculus var. scolymus]
MGYWKSTVVPKFKKIFEKNSTKKTAAAEACKSFDDAKEEYTKEFEEKKTELHTKVTEIYEASATEIKALVKEPKEASLKKNSAVVTSFLEELSKIEFPGSKPAHEACSKFGPTLVQGPIFFVFEKVSTFIVVEEKETTSSKEKDVVVEEEKKEEAAAAEGEVAKTEAEEVVVAPAEPPKTS